MPLDLARRIVLPLAALLQILASVVFLRDGFEESVRAWPVDPGMNPASPAPYAFGIWAVIFLGTVVFAVHHALESPKPAPSWSRLAGGLAAVGFLLAAAWSAVARFGPMWLTAPIIVGMLVAIGTSFLLAARHVPYADLVRQALVVTPLGLYAGWLTAATCVNLADAIRGHGLEPFGLSGTGWGLLQVGVVATIAVVVAVAVRGHLAYVAAVVWALAGIIAANLGVEAVPPVRHAAIATIVVLAFVTLLRQLPRRVAGSAPPAPGGAAPGD